MINLENKSDSSAESLFEDEYNLLSETKNQDDNIYLPEENDEEEEEEYQTIGNITDFTA